MQVADFAAPGASCSQGGAEFTNTTNGLQISARLCLSGQETRLSGPVNPIAPGRLAIDGIEPWWVLWADADYRTLVIGAPSGAFGFILNRDGPLPADRLTAASDIFAWNGYDLSRLVTR